MCARIFVLKMVFLACFSSIAYAGLPPQLPIPAAPALDAKAYVLQDNLSGRYIVEQNADQRLEPASLTKMMTVYVVDQELAAGRLSLEDPIRVSETAWRTEGSRMFVDVNSTVPVKVLLQGVIIQSGNDASVALAEHIAGTEAAFAQLMNHYAKQIGMNNTHFMNATGMPDPEHYTTAHDMALLAQALIRDFPETYKIYSQKEFFYNGIKQPNRNQLLWRDETVDGIKTGHTESAGFCLVASSQREGMRLNAVVMGAPSESTRADQAQTLLNYGFRFFKTRSILAGEKPIAQLDVYQGKTQKLPIGVKKDLWVTVPQNLSQPFATALEIQTPLKAPIAQGQVIGQLKVSVNDTVIAQEPLIALENVERGNWLRQFIDWIKLSIRKLFAKNSISNAIEGLELPG